MWIKQIYFNVNRFFKLCYFDKTNPEIFVENKLIIHGILSNPTEKILFMSGTQKFGCYKKPLNYFEDLKGYNENLCVCLYLILLHNCVNLHETGLEVIENKKILFNSHVLHTPFLG